MTLFFKKPLTTRLLGATVLALTASGATADIVHLDDVIIDGSLCVGFDCVNGEVFSFDTIRLKENNLRIKFEDTSTAASFPSNDWQLTANESANGGANKFSIEDISGSRTPFTIEANARSHSLYVDDGGRIGSRTSTPSTEIHTIDGDTPTLRLQQDGSSGFEPQTWDVAGNETNFFIRDVTNGSSLPFRIRPGAPTSAIFIDTDGDVGMGTTSPEGPLHVEETTDFVSTDPHLLVNNSNGAVSQRLMLALSNQGSSAMQFENRDTDVRWNMRNAGGGSSFLIDDPDSPNAEFTLTGAGDLTLEGGLVTGTAGSCTAGTPCDAVFDPEVYTVPSIEEHAAEMWQNQYLPAVGATRAGEPVHMTTKMLAMLNELEHAHIYIEQLNARVANLESQLGDAVVE